MFLTHHLLILSIGIISFSFFFKCCCSFVVFKEKYIKKQILFNKYFTQKDYCKVGRLRREETIANGRTSDHKVCKCLKS